MEKAINKVLIVGGNSSLGKELKIVLSNSFEVITAGRNGCDIQIDLKDSLEEIVLPENISVIINTAACFGGKEFIDVYDTENVNVLGTLKLCELAAKNKVCHLIHVSSIFSLLKPESEFYNIYSLSKKHSEELATYYCLKNDLPLTIIKPSQIYGVNNYFKKHQPFFYNIIEKAKNGEDVELYGKNDPLRNYIFIDDLTQIIDRIITQRIVGNYNCTYKENVTYSKIAELAINIFGSNSAVKFLTDKPNIPNNIFEYDDTLYKKIGFYPGVSIEQGIKLIAHS